MAMSRLRRRRDKWVRSGGVVLVETAIILPLLLTLTFGVIEYGWLFLKCQEITNAARQGARVAIRADATTAEARGEVESLLRSAGLGDSGYSVTFEPADVSFNGVDSGEAVTVRVTVADPGETVALIGLLPMPSRVGASVAMAKEGP